MNTPAHVIVGALVVGRGRLAEAWGPITAGSLLPDLPMFGFYLHQRLVAGHPERVIWSERYFDASWQAFFDVFNSLPLIAVGLAIAAWLGRERWLAFFAAMAVHALLDLPVHREDAHGHFFPLTDWRFMSPVSYWDPAHYGTFVLAIETLAVVAGAIVLMRREPRGWRAVGAVTLASYLAFGVFVLVAWSRGAL